MDLTHGDIPEIYIGCNMNQEVPKINNIERERNYKKLGCDEYSKIFNRNNQPKKKNKRPVASRVLKTWGYTS